MVRNLIRRRFVAAMYDVAPPNENYGDGWAYDADAVATIGSIEKLHGGPLSGGIEDEEGRVYADCYPAALFLLPDGTLLGRGLWGILPPQRMVAELKKLIAAHPEHFAPTAAEQAVLTAAQQRPDDPVAQLEAARLHWELADFENAAAAAARVMGSTATASCRDEAAYLRGRALLCLDRDAEARAAFESASTDGDFADAIAVGCARLDQRAGEHRRALGRLAALREGTPPSAWTGAALYYSGLSHHRLGDGESASVLWRRHRESMPFDRLARRSASSLGIEEAEAFANQELVDKRGWW